MTEAAQDGSREGVTVPAEDLSPGQAMARARRDRNLTTADVAQHLKFGVRQIDALEADDYSKLPGDTFVRGMIRSYAKLLQIDPAPVLEAHRRRHIPSEVTVDLRSKRIPFPDGVKRSSKLYGLLTLFALLAVVAVVYEWQVHPPSKQGGRAEATLVQPTPVVPPDSSGGPQEAKIPNPASGVGISAALSERTSPLTISPEPEVAITSVRLQKPAIPGSLHRLQLEFAQESWVEIKQADGRTLISQLNPGGTRRVIEGRPPFSVVIGNAPNVRLTYNDESVDLRSHFKVDVARLTLE